MPGLVSNSMDVLDDGTSRQDLWDRIFSDGLEVLLVECAMVNDDIERDCFISRVYCWFTEKLSERRELPKKGIFIAFSNIKVSLFFVFVILFLFSTRCCGAERAEEIITIHEADRQPHYAGLGEVIHCQHPTQSLASSE